VLLPKSVARLEVEDIQLDGEGRIAITDPQAVQGLKVVLAARRNKPKPRPKPNTNCFGCNATQFCGGHLNTGPNCTVKESSAEMARSRSVPAARTSRRIRTS
jgi:hypothetical protein